MQQLGCLIELLDALRHGMEQKLVRLQRVHLRTKAPTLMVVLHSKQTLVFESISLTMSYRQMNGARIAAHLKSDWWTG